MKQVKNNNLLASIAVFAELCNTEKNIQGILTSFIKSVFVFEKIWAPINSVEMTLALKKHFDFDLPEAVVRTCLNDLAKNGFAVKKKGRYSITDTSYNVAAFEKQLFAKKSKQEIIEGELVSHCESLLKTKVSDADRKALIDEFISYLLDEAGVSEKYSTVISSFVIKSEKDDFILELNQIKEGVVLLTGLGYTDDLDNIGLWSEELTIYLDTEHLFNSEGYNGKLYEKLFDDFFTLVKEINGVAQKKYSKRLIHLKFFEEIGKGCVQIRDIIKKKTIFETNLRTRGITVKEGVDPYRIPEYNIGDASLIEKYQGQFEEKHIVYALRLLTKINLLRKGVNEENLEKCKHIILTGKTITRQLSMDLDIKNKNKAITLATDTSL